MHSMLGFVRSVKKTQVKLEKKGRKENVIHSKPATCYVVDTD